MPKRIALLTAICVLAFPALASAKIVLNSSIAGIHLGEAKSTVHGAFGKPTKVIAPSSTTQGQTQWVYKGRALLVGFKNNHVVEVFTESRSQKTSGGIGVGSSIASVKSHIKGVVCQHVPPYSGQECVIGVRHGSSLWTTDFHIGPKGHVFSVLVNILPNVAGALDRALAAAL